MASRLTKIKEVKNAHLLQTADGTSVIKLFACRASYPYLGTPSDDKNEDTGEITHRHRVTFQLPKATHEEAYRLIREVIDKLQKDNKANVETAFWFIKNGDKSDNETDHGYWLVNAAETVNTRGVRPRVMNAKAELIQDTAVIDQMFYGGCYINGIIRPWFFDGKSKKVAKKLVKRISAGLESVQFLRDGEPYGRTRIDDSDQYAAVDSDDDGMGGGAPDDDDDL